MSKPAIIAALLIIFGLLFICFISIGRKKSKETFLKASSHEENGKAEEACYTYAIAARQGAREKDCREKIKTLWDRHGPFDFSDCLNKAKSEYLGEGEGHGEGYHEGLVDYIRKVVSSK